MENEPDYRELLKNRMMRELSDSDIVWGKYGDDTIEALAERLTKLVRGE